MDISALLRTVIGVDMTSSPKNYDRVFEQLNTIIRLRDQRNAISEEMNRALKEYIGYMEAIVDLEERENKIIAELTTMVECKLDTPRIKYSPD